MTTAGATNSPFGWSSFAVMARDEAQRAGDLLRDQGIPVITRPADDEKSELLVPTASAGRARGLLEAAPAPAPTEDEPEPDSDEGRWDTDDGDDAEGRLEDLSDMFDAADRLKHQPWNEGAAAELDRALEGMTGRSAPYGIADAFWDRARRTAADLQEMIRTGQLEDTIGNAAEALRDLLRPYI